MAFRVPTALLLLFVGLAAPATAQPSVKLEFHDGQVNLLAENAPIRAVLAEWARLGGATIVNGDRVAGPPVTLQLEGVPERQALDILLRSVAGYMLAPRPIGSAGVSAFDRILILPTSVAPRNPPPAPVAAQRPMVRPPIIMPQPDGIPVDVIGGFPQNPEDMMDDQFIDDPMPQMPQTQQVRPGFGIPRIGAPGMVMPPQPLSAEPRIITFDGSEEQAQPEAEPVGIAPTPGNPFGMPFGSSARPGVITPVPQPEDGVQ